jgi:short-subunit dehydrogenase
MENTTKGSFAVVTGASSGIGLELAKQFAEHGFHLLIVADSPKIAEAAKALQNYGVSVSEAQIDLAKPEGVDACYRAMRNAGRAVDAIALNAGVGAGGDFVRETALDADLNVIDLNVRSTVHLAKLVLKDMVQRGQSRVCSRLRSPRQCPARRRQTSSITPAWRIPRSVWLRRMILRRSPRLDLRRSCRVRIM